MRWPRGTFEAIHAFATSASFSRTLVQWAADALAQGFDSASLRRLACLDLGEEPGAFEVEEAFERALSEIGVPKLGREQAIRLRLRELAVAILDGRMDELVGVEAIHDEIVVPLEHASDVQPWCDLSDQFERCGDEIRFLTRTDCRRRARELAAEAVRTIPAFDP
jgi:hypothetical protein